MRCADARIVMMELLDNVADPAQRAALLGHTAQCAACWAEWQALQKLDALLTAAPMAAPPADFTQRVLARLRTTSTPVALSPHAPSREGAPSDSTRAPQWSERHRGANPLGGIMVLMLGGVLLFVLLAAPLLQHAWPAVWKLLIAPRGASSVPLGDSALLIGTSQTLQTLWRLHRPVLRSVGPLLFAGYTTATLLITLFWLRLVVRIQQVLSVQ